jgi:F-type H+-transporting ATPase subunit a
MPEQLLFTSLLNHWFAGPTAALLRALHIQPQYRDAPITNAVAMEVLVVAFLVVVFIMVRSRLSVESPSGLQHMFEGLLGFIEGQSRDIIGDHSEVFTPFLVTIGLFILIANLLGLIPGFESPTSSPVVPLGCAVCAFFYYHLHGFERHGLGYLKQFLGHQDPSTPIFIRIPVSLLMVLIEPISHLARVLSLTIRLYANIFAGDMVTAVFFSLVPLVVPVIFLGLHFFVALLQAFIFVLLTTVYLAGAVGEEH